WARLSNDLNTVELVKCGLDIVNPYYTGSSFNFEKLTLGQYDRVWVVFFFKFKPIDKRYKSFKAVIEWIEKDSEIINENNFDDFSIRLYKKVTNKQNE
ncbi:MAG: hypothetical protein PHQ54_04205, partial [Candidatus Omnitrophica bacterium]|nr:hypothetical protein [Candidatus Omnitrophota bacterium]